MTDEQRSFVDTNILAYAFDESDEKRRKPCEKLVKQGFSGESSLSVSNQILGELFVVLTKKMGKTMPRDRAGLIVSGFIDSPKWLKTSYTHATIKRAIQDTSVINCAFWDLMIAETMREAGITRIYTENERDFKSIPWISVINPIHSK
ncbi:MAG: PIN domain-containing protein [Nitrososphaerales archaeon]